MSRLLGQPRRGADAPTTFFADWSAEEIDAARSGAEQPRRRRQVDSTTSRRVEMWQRSAPLRRRALALSTLAASAAAVVVFAPGPSAQADPSPHTWYRLRMCESSDNYRINTGNGYYGAYQFDLSTWRSVGGSGYPNQASPAEQDARALMLYRMRGWQPWTCASILGLHNDADAGSGRTGDIHIGGSGGGSGGSHGSHSGIPAFPGSRWYHFGDWNNDIKQFQNQMHDRGFFPPGTGQYGPLTLAMVKRLQALNGLPATGYIGPNTWRLAWTGKYSNPPAHHPTPAPSPRPKPAPRPGSSGTAPAFPGHRFFRYGDRNNDVKRFQDELHSRGVFPAGTGQFGPLTLAMVKNLQQANGYTTSGMIGPKTWALAWTGKLPRSTSPTPASTHRRSATSVPRFPGIRWYRLGDWSTEIRVFQNAMHHRGLFPAGTGQYGPKTLHMVKRLQRLNGLIPNGLIGPKTWRLAWTGKYK